jgi:hypothetical protein
MATEDRPPPRRPAPSANRPPFTPRPAPGNEEKASAQRQRQPRPAREREPRSRDEQQTQRPQLELPKVDFDPTRVKLPQIAIVGFLIGIFFHACVVFAILDDGSGSKATTPSGAETTTEQQVEDDVTTQPTVIPTLDPKADRKDCNAIRADPNYRSEAERQWFLTNCVR